MSRLIDADAYADEMRKRQDACCKWHSEQNPGSEMYARAEQALVTFIEARLTLENQPTIDVIPVEWIEWRIAHAEREGFVEVVSMLRTVRDWWNDQRDVWQKERGAHDRANCSGLCMGISMDSPWMHNRKTEPSQKKQEEARAMRRGDYESGIALTDRYAQLQQRTREMASELRYYKGRCELLGKRLERVGVEYEKLKGRNTMTKLRIQLDAGAFAPQRAHEWDAGYDLRSRDDVMVWAEDSETFDTGVHVEIPKGWCGQVWSKSGLYVKRGITATGLIDAGYSGAIVVKLQNHSAVPYKVNRGDKIAQLVLVPCAGPEIELVDTIEGGERGNNGFGSTGR